MLTTKTMTLIFMVIIIVIIAVYDTVVAVNDISGDTISEITLAWAMKHPIAVVCLGIVIGILLGHIFWPQKV